MHVRDQRQEEKLFDEKRFIDDLVKPFHNAKSAMCGNEKNWDERFAEWTIFFSTQVSQHQM